MVRSRLPLALCVAGIVLAGSDHAKAGWFSSDDLVEYQGSDAGVLVLSLGAYKGADYSVYRLFFRTRDKSKTAQLTYSRSARPDYSNDYIAGAVRTYSLEPGEYEFYDFELFFTNGFLTEHFSAKEPFSIPFTIKPTQTIYLGEFRAMPLSGSSLIGLPAHAGAKFQLSDQSARDLPLAKSQNSLVAIPEIRIPDPTVIASPLFERLPGSGN